MTCRVEQDDVRALGAAVAAVARPVAVAPRFVEVQAAAPVRLAANVPSATSTTRLSVSFPDGVVVRGGNPVALAALVRALRAN